MTVNYVEEIASGRRATNDKGARSYSRAFRLNTTQQSEGPYAVGSHPSLPIIGSTHPEDSGAWCTTLTVENSDPWKGWTVTADYSTERELATDPTNDPAVISVTTEQFQKVADKDINGNATTNSAGDPYDPPHMMDDSRRTIHITKNMSGHPSWLLSYSDVVNSDTFTVKGITYAIGTGKVQGISIGPDQTRNGVTFVEVSYSIQLQRDGWLHKPLDVGFREKVAGQMLLIKGSDFQLVSAPVPLDGNGLVQQYPTTDSAVFNSYTIYTTASFASLPLT
jgi:hypothetical protein